jgi:hypothetical protein
MESVLIAVAALACPVGMGAMMFFMARGMRRGEKTGHDSAPVDVDVLRAEHERLGQEIERLEDGRRAELDEVAR